MYSGWHAPSVLASFLLDHSPCSFPALRATYHRNIGIAHHTSRPVFSRSTRALADNVMTFPGGDGLIPPASRHTP
ncbi:hypothetical protein FKP32DRAFT_721157 [Trametes sanguinea]|nr:hypothetical protein FKP32DRAFT_721157 [Trametes sanguinea]